MVRANQELATYRSGCIEPGENSGAGGTRETAGLKFSFRDNYLEKHRNCTVKVKGETAYIYQNGKKILTKRLSTNGFEYTTGEELKAQKRRKIENKKRMAVVRKNLITLLKGKKLKTTGYFEQFERNPDLGLVQSVDEVSYTPISHKAFMKLFFNKNDSVQYAERAIDDFNNNGMARIGLHTLACLYRK